MLGRLEKVNDLRSIWRHEALDFTKWLAENISQLADEIGIEINLLETEASVGGFNVDILADEENTGRKIVIENQLESTNHDHLGKLITYASGYNAQIIIWLVKDVREEHRQAVDWLNEHTDQDLNFFLIRLELWKIDDSPCAVKFQIVSRPNDWAKNIKQTANNTSISNTQQLQLEFWNEFREFGKEKNARLKFRKPFPQHWYDMSYGVPGSNITLTMNIQNKTVSCEIYIHDSKQLFHHYESQREQIEKDLGYPLQWMELPTKKASRIRVFREIDVKEHKNWNAAYEWMLEQAQKFNVIFYKYSINK